MKIKCPLLLIMLVISSLVAAQNAAPPFQIKGVLLDSLTQEGEPYATIKIVKKEAPAHALKMLVTDMKGKFQEKVPGTGDFVMTISSIGRNTIVKDFTVKAGEKVVDFGTLYITDASNELGQVEVVAQKPLVKADIDKIEYNVQDDPDSKSNSVLEMLRKVPLVTVDGEDNIKVNGSSSFKVYVNGKPNNMMSNNPTEVLKSMPANSIKHIEVITNPGPKYDAEGVGGILNIVTAVLFQSPVQHFALAPNNLTDAPEWAIGFMKEVPTTWDEVRFIDGYPGKYVVMARRHGDKWYVAGVNAQKETVKLKIALPMFMPGDQVRVFTDNEELQGNVKQIKVNKKQELQLAIPCNGGILIVE